MGERKSLSAVTTFDIARALGTPSPENAESLRRSIADYSNPRYSPFKFLSRPVMASSSIGNSSPEAAEEQRNWLELPREVTASIMSRLVAVEILTNVQVVCKAWLEIAHDPLVWRRVDMSKVGDLGLEMDLDKMCRCAVDRSSGQLTDK